ncbi:hypothetical protein Pcinc_000028 [Petrolisthes cinctipes]|uniref:Uncharacterized protein n=1 Tax=Petrolisthes cinctipes TaxID=88211 RepID=A0AAE1GQJ6_PETCI|nr:hypothetical protein Pcinc_000028 [Petrolisthes cinctipes]
MKKAIWATFYHCTSTDSQPRHNLCPHGEKSWCFWNRAIALQEKEREENDRLQREKEEALGESSASCVSFYGKRKKPKTSFKMPSLKDMKIFFSLEKSDLDKVKQLYIRLTDEDLLKRCLQGKMQNLN